MARKSKTYEELVREWDKKIESGREAEGLTPVKARVTPNGGTHVSFRLSTEDFVAFSKAAQDRGLSLSAFLRQAAYAVIEGEVDVEDGARRKAIEDAVDSLSRATNLLRQLNG
jgi:hypothetical protein